MKHIFEYLINRKLTAKDHTKHNKYRLKEANRKIFRDKDDNYYIELTCDELIKLSDYYLPLKDNPNSMVSQAIISRLRKLYHEVKTDWGGDNVGLSFYTSYIHDNKIFCGWNPISIMISHSDTYELCDSIEVDLEELTPEYIESNGWLGKSKN